MGNAIVIGLRKLWKVNYRRTLSNSYRDLGDIFDLMYSVQNFDVWSSLLKSFYNYTPFYFIPIGYLFCNPPFACGLWCLFG